MNYNIDPKTLKKASPRVVEPEYKHLPASNTFVFEGKTTDTGNISEKHSGASGKLECYIERLRPNASHDTVSHPKKTKVISVISGVLHVDFVEEIPSTRTLTVGEFIHLDPTDVYRLFTGDVEAVFSVVQEDAYESRLLTINETKKAGDEELKVPTVVRYKSKAKEQLAFLNPQSQVQPVSSNTSSSNSGDDWNARPLSEAELEAL